MAETVAALATRPARASRNASGPGAWTWTAAGKPRPSGVNGSPTRSRISTRNWPRSRSTHPGPQSSEPIKTQQVINAVIAQAIKDDLLAGRSILNERGKRANAKMAEAMTELWDNEVEFVPTAVGDYLAGKMIELLPKEAAPAVQGELSGI